MPRLETLHGIERRFTISPGPCAARDDAAAYERRRVRRSQPVRSASWEAL
jgi:hypothetical protein